MGGSAGPVDADHSPTRLARAGSVSFAGSVVGAVLGFVLTLLLARVYGGEGAGVVLQAIAVFVIGLSVGRGGLDTAATWIVPRLLDSPHDELGAAIRHIVVLSLAGGAVAGMLTMAAARLLFERDVYQAVFLSAWAMPLAAVTLVGTTVLRAFGGIRSYILIVQVVIPVLRVAFILVLVALGYGAVLGGLGWALPYAVGAVLTFAILLRTLSRLHGARLQGRVTRETRQRVHRYRLGRMVASILEQGLLWMDVLLVGVLVSTTAAGVYGSVARFVAAGLIVDTALRFVMAPIFSRLLYAERREESQELFVRTTVWLVLLSVPISLGLAVYAPLVLTWLGPDFAEGELAMQILCLGTALALTAGNVHTLLLMSGRSGQVAINKLVVLCANVGLNVLLVPIWGIEAAAAVWAVSMLMDASLAAWQVRRAAGLRPEPMAVGYAVLVTLLTVGVPAVLWRAALGATVPSLLAAALSGALLLGSWVYLDRHRLHMGELLDPVRARLRR